jgi:small subunit ribosomal protein S1
MSTSNKSARMAEFEALLNQQLAGYRKGFNPGERVEARVLSIGKNHIILDVQAKNEGLVPVADFTDEEGKVTVAEGDTITVVFANVQGGAFMFTGRLTGGVAVDQTLAQAYASGLPVEGKVTAEVNGGYEVMIGGRRGFCPYSQISLFRQEGAVYVGETFNFIVQEYDEEERNVVVSRRALLEREREQQREELQQELEVGATRSGRVTRLTDFGFFVDLGGVEGLVPMKEISYRRDVKPADVVKEGESVEVLVRELDWERNRISLSLRGAQPDPFDMVATRYPVGSTVRGKVTHIESFGAFVELEPGVEGLVPTGALGSGRRISSPREVVSEGQEMLLQVESVDIERRRMSLRPIDERLAAMQPASLAAGARVEGLVEGYKPFGVFVRLSESQTGLLHISETDVSKGGNPEAKLERAFPPGSKIGVVVKENDGQRISLTLPGRWQAGAVDEEQVALDALRARPPAKDLGSLGDLLDGLKL